MGVQNILTYVGPWSESEKMFQNLQPVHFRDMDCPTLKLKNPI